MPLALNFMVSYPAVPNLYIGAISGLYRDNGQEDGNYFVDPK